MKKIFQGLDLGFLVDDVMGGVCFAFIFMMSSPIQRTSIVAQSFIGF